MGTIAEAHHCESSKITPLPSGCIKAALTGHHGMSHSPKPPRPADAQLLMPLSKPAPPPRAHGPALEGQNPHLDSETGSCA